MEHRMIRRTKKGASMATGMLPHGDPRQCPASTGQAPGPAKAIRYSTDDPAVLNQRGKDHAQTFRRVWNNHTGV